LNNGSLICIFTQNNQQEESKMAAPKPHVEMVELDLGDIGYHECEVHFWFSAGYPATMDEPGAFDEYEIEHCYWNGVDIAEWLTKAACDNIEDQLDSLR
jgi:hypothetical protein